MDTLTKENIYLARKFSNSFRYIDDLITFNNDKLMNKHKHHMYPKELILNNENKIDTHCTFLDINLDIKNNMIYTNIYDKRDDFDFTINNFPNLSSNIHFMRTHGIIISQLVRFARVCMEVNDFISKSKVMVAKLAINISIETY